MSALLSLSSWSYLSNNPGGLQIESEDDRLIVVMVACRQGALGGEGPVGAGGKDNSKATEGAEGKTFLKRRSQAFVSQK